MDHFRIPPGQKHLTIPCYCPEPFNGASFRDYPKSRGWTLDDLLGVDNFNNRSPQEIESFFQDWLFFSFLSNALKIVDIPFQKSQFIKKEPSGEYILTTANLLKILEPWINWQNLPSGKEYDGEIDDIRASQIPKHRSDQLIELFEDVFPWINRYCSRNRNEFSPLFASGERKWPVSDEVSMGIIALAHTLTDYYGSSVDRLHGITSLTDWGSSHFLTKKLREKGWCFGDIELIHDEGRIPCSYYFSYIPGPRSDGDHSKCTTMVCSAATVVVGKYKTKHVDESCDCEMIGVKGMEDLIAKGKDDMDGSVPLVVWKKDKETRKWDLQLEEYNVKTLDIPYVAISHVWSDGLGNPTQNTLPRCQLERIQKMIKQLYEERMSFDTESGHYHGTSIPFWMDTLCCPVGDAYRPLRIDTIRKMRNIYSRAERVLVLDGIIQKCPLSMPIVERTAVLYISNWFRRLWTLQEGALAKKVFFRFKDGTEEPDDYDETFQKARWSDGQVLEATYRMPTNFLTAFGLRDGDSDLLESSDEDEEDSDSDLLDSSDEDEEDGKWEGEGSQGSWESAGSDDSHPADPDKDEDDSENDEKSDNSENVDTTYSSLYFEQLHRRATTRDEDETVCMASVLKIDNGPLFATNNCEEKMEIFNSMMHPHTQPIIFNTFPRLQKGGFRWSPRSYLGVTGKVHPSKCVNKPARLIEGKGLTVEYPGFTLGQLGKNIKEMFVVSTGKENWSKFRVWKPEDETQWPEKWDSDAEYVLITHEEYHIFGDDRRRKYSGETRSLNYDAPFEHGVDAIIATKKSVDEDGRIAVIHVCRALIWPGLKNENFVEDLPPREWLLKGADGTPLPELEDIEISQQQLWYVG